MREVRTGCPYCGVGCGLVAEVAGGRLAGVRGDPDHPVNRGRVCAKPVALPEASGSPDRATVPLWRDEREERFRPASWEVVLDRVAGRLEAIRAEHGPGSVAFYLSGQLLTEDYYAAVKLAKGFLGTNHVDSNSRLCMSSAVAAYDLTFGADGPPPCYDDIEAAGCLLLLGSNTAACHPILWSRIRERQAAGATLIVVDPRRTETAAAADLHLPVRPGTDLVLLNAMLAVAAAEGRVDTAWLDRHAEGHEAALRAAARWTPERAAEHCEVPAADIVAAARAFAGSPASLAMWSMGANQSVAGTAINRALHALCLATGHLGRPGAGPLSLTGQPNAMGGREVGGLAQLLPGYRKVASAEHRAEMAAAWKLPPSAAGIAPEPGLPATDLFDALEDGRIRAVWICGTNPVVSMPDAERARAALRAAELVVSQDAYHPTETGALAHALLPAAQWPEKDGTMTNSERRVTLVRRAVDPPGEALPDWAIFARLAARLGWGEHFAWREAAEVHAEFVALTANRPCDQSGVSHARLREEGPLRWPCPSPEHPGTPRLYADGRCHTPTGRARLVPGEPTSPAEPTDGRFPLVLTTGRVASQWHTMTRTGKARRLREAEPAPFVEVHPEDARRAGVAQGELARVVSRRGAALLRVRLDPSLPEGTAFAPFHWGELHGAPGAATVNDLTHRRTDPVSRQPALKASAVRLEPVRTGPGRAPAAPRRLLVVGAGPAGVEAAGAVLAHAPAGAWEVTLVGREPAAPYDRVALSDLLAGRRETASLALRPPEWYAEHGVRLLTGAVVAEADPAAREAVLSTGERLGWDALVLATGSRPLLPPIEGAELPGVVAFRTLADVDAMLAAAPGARRAAVIGGGLLGLEAARGLGLRGVPTAVVHLGDRLMERQLDPPAGRLLARAVGELGIEVLLGRATTRVLGEARAEGLRFASGEEIEADLVVIAAGIVPETNLAARMGLEVGRGVVVDDEMRTSARGVWAVGECAEHRGTVHGLVAPVLAQARTAGASVAGKPAPLPSAPAATRLKVAGVELFTTGDAAALDGDEEIAALDSRAGRYRRLLVRDGRLAGAILFGDLRESGRLADLVRTGAPVPPALLDTGDPGPPEEDDADFVCTCAGVTRGTVVEAVRERSLGCVEQVADATRACTGCGTCRSSVEAILRSLAASH